MARFVFTDNFNWRITGTRSMLEFKARPEPQTVKREVAEAAEAAGYGHYADDDNDADATSGQTGELADGDPGTGRGLAADDDVSDAGSDDEAGDVDAEE